MTVKNEKTGEERVVKSNAQGLYRVTHLRPAVYTIRAESGQLAPTEYTGIELAAGLAMTLDLELSPPGVTETVTVTGAAPSLDLSSARIGVNVNEREVQNLPINGRQMSQLMLQAPGAVNTGTGTWQDIRFSGRAVEQNVIRYDGVEGIGNHRRRAGQPQRRGRRRRSSCRRAWRTSRSSASSPATIPAEFGTGTRRAGIGRSPSPAGNIMHGSVFEYFRERRVRRAELLRHDAPGLPKSQLNQNQFGGSIGGPIVKNRAFFFASYEGYR